jgi:hypothetical protein
LAESNDGSKVAMDRRIQLRLGQSLEKQKQIYLNDLRAYVTGALRICLNNLGSDDGSFER